MEKIEIEQARQIMLDLLLEFSDYCDKYGLRYHLAYGTLIGAVRHKGFIPWDNDLDVTMPRPDYEKFRKLVRQQLLAPHISCLDYEYCDTFPFVKIVDNRTVCKEHFLVTEENMGIYIDVFPLDGMPDNRHKQKLLLNKVKMLNILYAIKNARFNTGSGTFKRLVKNILHPLAFVISNKWLGDCYNNLCKKYNYDECTTVGNIVWGGGKEDIYPKKWFETTYGEFEGYTFKIPKGWDAFLSQYYGDYMTLPPEEERVVHQYEAYWK